MELDFNKKEKTAGIFIIGIAILLLATVIIIGRGKDWFKTYITYYTAFEESYNLMVDTPVKLFNADIGKVKDITPVGNKVKVTLIILKDYQSRIRTDSVATVESPTLIGSEYISIIPGSKDAPLIP
ncbi:MAG: MCE family protein, partial [Desulfobulbaceae bacterium]|nr:MCE family protein [Desulfobulbaceae bacterium]